MSGGALAELSLLEPFGLDRRLRGLCNLVGHTPLLEISFVRHGRRRRIHAKAGL